MEGWTNLLGNPGTKKPDPLPVYALFSIDLDENLIPVPCTKRLIPEAGWSTSPYGLTEISRTLATNRASLHPEELRSHGEPVIPGVKLHLLLRRPPVSNGDRNEQVDFYSAEIERVRTTIDHALAGAYQRYLSMLAADNSLALHNLAGKFKLLANDASIATNGGPLPALPELLVPVPRPDWDDAPDVPLRQHFPTVEVVSLDYTP